MTTIPIVGKQIVFWLWGGFSIDHPTLNRFYSLHYTLPFVLAGLSIFHIAALHQYGSTNPLGINTQSSTIHFGIYFLSKDLLALLFFILVFAVLVFFYPEYLGQKLAIFTGNSKYNYSAICWENHLLFSTWGDPLPLLNRGRGPQTISGMCKACFVRLFAVKKLIKAPLLLLFGGGLAPFQLNMGAVYEQSAGNCSCPFRAGPIKKGQGVHTQCESLASSSGTTRVTTYSGPMPPYDNFGTWLAGLIDGDGCLQVSKNKSVSVEITLASKDVQCLHKIKTIFGFGSVTKRTGVNAFRYRIYKKEHVLTILNLINGYLLTSSKHTQLIKLCAFFNIKPIIPDYATTLLIVKESSWLAGFFDAEGHFTIMNKHTLSFNIGQKDRSILDSIKDTLQLGHIRLDIKSNSWVYTISDKEGMRFILNFFKPIVYNDPKGPGHFYINKIGLCTTKKDEVWTFKRLLSKIDSKDHLLPTDNPKRIEVENLIMQFKNRNRLLLTE